MRAAIKNGATILTSRVERIDDGAGGVRVITAADTFEADAVVVATGSWAAPSMGVDQPARTRIESPL